MKRLHVRRIATIAFMAVGAAAMAQDAPPAEDAPAQESTPKYNSITLSYTHTKLSGDSRQANRFGQLPDGFSVSELLFHSPFLGDGPAVNFTWRGLPGDDTWFGGSYVTANGLTNLKASGLRRGYYQVPITPTDQSQDKVAELSLQQSLAPNLGAYLTFRKANRSQHPAAPLDVRRNSAETHGAGIAGQFGSSNFDVSASQTRFTTPDHVVPNTVTTNLSGNYSVELAPTFSLMAGGSWSKIHRVGGTDGTVRSLGFAGVMGLSDSSLLHFDLSQQDISVPGISTGYDRKRLSIGTRLVTRWNGWAFQAGYRHKESEHVRADHTYVDVPKWDTFDFRASGRLTDDLRMTVRGTWDNLLSSTVPGTDDIHQLLWDDKVMGQVKVDGGNETTTGYFMYTYRFRQNKQRSVEIGWHNFAAGFSSILSPSVTGYVEASYDVFRAGGEIEGTSETLRDYFPDSLNATLGLDWARSDKDSFSASLNMFGTNNVRGNQITLSYRRDISADQSFQLTVAPWQYVDRLYGQTGYNATIMSLSYKVKF